MFWNRKVSAEILTKSEGPHRYFTFHELKYASYILEKIQDIQEAADAEWGPVQERKHSKRSSKPLDPQRLKTWATALHV